jgi:Ice-binding-like
MNNRINRARLLVAPGLAVALAIGALAFGLTAFAAGPAPVGLGTAAPFAVLAGTPAVTNTGPTTITGDLGISPAAAVTGFPPGTVNGTIHAADAVALQAKSDLVIAYTDAAGRTPATTVAGGTLGGKTLVAGVYSAGGSTLGLTGTLTLDGQNDPSAVWIFQATSDLVTASSSTVRFINGASACNVFWQVTSSATLGSGSTFAGTILALTSITLNSGVTLDGRALARNGDVTLIDDTITRATCSAATATPSPSASPSASPAASPSATPSATPAATPAPSTTPATPGATLPPTTTLPATDLPGSGSTPIVLVGVFFAVFALLAGRRSLRVIRSRAGR